MELKRNIGKRIKELRKKQNLSQEKLAEMVDLAQNTLSCIETGDNFFTAETLDKLITALEIEPKDLFEFSSSKTNEDLLNEINKILQQNPDKIQEYYKILKAIVY